MVLTIYVDSREKARIHALLKEMHPEINFVKTTMDSGDFTAMDLDKEGKNKYNQVIVERKAIADLDNSIRKGSFIKQFDKLVTKQNMVYVLLVIGDLGKFVSETHRQRFRPNAYAGTLLREVAELTTRYNCHVIWATEEKVAFELMIRFIKAVDTGKYDVPAGRDYDNLCARLIGITYKQWIELKGDGRSLVEISKMSINKMTKIKGLGKKKAERIKMILNEGE